MNHSCDCEVHRRERWKVRFLIAAGSVVVAAALATLVTLWVNGLQLP